jgi:hypothetical protein
LQQLQMKAGEDQIQQHAEFEGAQQFTHSLHTVLLCTSVLTKHMAV